MPEDITDGDLKVKILDLANRRRIIGCDPDYNNERAFCTGALLKAFESIRLVRRQTQIERGSEIVSVTFPNQTGTRSEIRRAKDYMDIQSRFINKILEHKDVASRSVNVYGFTYAVFWTNFMSRILTNNSVREWSFSLYFTDPEHLRSNRQFFDDDWIADADVSRTRMLEWLPKHQAEFQARGVDLRVYSYGCVPFVHGKEWGDGTVFIRCAQWKNNRQSLDYPNSFREIISKEDNSPRAEAYRDLFRDWARKIRESKVETIFPRV